MIWENEIGVNWVLVVRIFVCAKLKQVLEIELICRAWFEMDFSRSGRSLSRYFRI